MTSKIKALGLALVAVAAMSAVAASATQAGSFDVGAQPAIVSGHDEEAQDHLFTITPTDKQKPPLKISCSTGWIEAATVGQQSLQEATGTATYGGDCKLGSVAVQVRLNGCKYTLTGSGQPANTATVDIVGCTQPMTGITITPFIGCQFRIPEQNGLSHVVGKEPNPTTNPHTVTLEVTISGITVHQSGTGCPDCSGHLGTNGSFQGNTILKATQHDGSVQVTEHNHKFDKFNITGAQVSLTST
jgi:hypothetical protein